MENLVTMLVFMISSQVKQVQAAHSNYYSQNTREMVNYKFSLQQGI